MTCPASVRLMRSRTTMRKAALTKPARSPANPVKCKLECDEASRSTHSSLSLAMRTKPLVREANSSRTRQTSLLYVGMPPYAPKVSVCRPRITGFFLECKKDTCRISSGYSGIDSQSLGLRIQGHSSCDPRIRVQAQFCFPGSECLLLQTDPTQQLSTPGLYRGAQSLHQSSSVTSYGMISSGTSDHAQFQLSARRTLDSSRNCGGRPVAASAKNRRSISS